MGIKHVRSCCLLIFIHVELQNVTEDMLRCLSNCELQLSDFMDILTTLFLHSSLASLHLYVCTYSSNIF